MKIKIEHVKHIWEQEYIACKTIKTKSQKIHEQSKLGRT
jgi:hypothetical protein